MSDGEGAAPVVFKKKGSSNVRKRAADVAEERDDTRVDTGPRRTKLSESALVFKSEKEKKEEMGIQSTMSAVPAGPEDGGATLINVLGADEAEAFEAKLAQQQRKTGVVQERKSIAGPVKAPVFIRQTIRLDLQPDVCKDYKETGTCGFGDACKFVHDRGDYKSGWQLEKEWAEEQKALKHRKAIEEDEGIAGSDSDDMGDLPFACHICREPFTKPVVTRCGHYFCEKCALQRFITNKRCAVCDKPTNGIFNPATALIKALEKRDRRLEEKAARQPQPAESAEAESDD